MGELISTTRESFRDDVAQGLVLVDVWGPSCRPCLALMPHVERLASQREDLRVLKLEAPKARRLCIELKVHGLPSFLLFRDGQELARLSAPSISPAQLSQWLEATLVGSPGQADHDQGREEVSR